MERKFIKLKSSDMSFLDCPRCLWLEVNHGIKQPQGPSSFGALMKQKSEQIAFLKDKSLSVLDSEGNNFPKGKIVKSNSPFATAICDIEGCDFIMSGKYDFLIKLDDDSYCVASFKNSDPTKNLEEYAKQLNSIRWSLSKKEKDEIKVSTLGVFYFDPTAFYAGKTNAEIYKWFPVAVDDKGITALIKDTVKMLAGKEPEPGRDEKDKICSFCERDQKIIAYQVSK